MYKPGTIILTPFPFSNLAKSKVRPALIISQEDSRLNAVIVCFITSNPKIGKHAVRIEKSPQTGLKISSVVRFDKIATLEKNIILGELGKVDDDFFQKYQQKFFDVFAFTKLL